MPETVCIQQKADSNLVRP